MNRKQSNKIRENQLNETLILWSSTKLITLGQDLSGKEERDRERRKGERERGTDKTSRNVGRRDRGDRKSVV